MDGIYGTALFLKQDVSESYGRVKVEVVSKHLHAQKAARKDAAARKKAGVNWYCSKVYRLEAPGYLRDRPYDSKALYVGCGGIFVNLLAALNSTLWLHCFVIMSQLYHVRLLCVLDSLHFTEMALYETLCRLRITLVTSLAEHWQCLRKGLSL